MAKVFVYDYTTQTHKEIEMLTQVARAGRTVRSPMRTPVTWRIRHINGKYLGRDYKFHIWVWADAESNCHYFVSRDEANRVLQSIPAICQASLEGN